MRAQKQRNDYGYRNCDHPPDNFLSRHAAPANNWTRTLEYMLPSDYSHQDIHGCIYYSIQSVPEVSCLGKYGWPE